jgi:hypothetical protein
MYLLGALMRDKGYYQESENLILRSIEIFEEAISNENLVRGEYQFMPQARLELGRLYFKMGKLSESKVLLLESLNFYEMWNQEKKIRLIKEMLGRIDIQSNQIRVEAR